VADLTQRAASLEDLRDIWGLLQQVASDIPADLGSEATQENILTELMACCTSGLSPIAVDKDKSDYRSTASEAGRFRMGLQK
jgi:hypothetical protein